MIGEWRRCRASVDCSCPAPGPAQALRNPALKERHWTKLFKIIGQILARDNTFTLQVSLASQPPEYSSRQG